MEIIDQNLSNDLGGAMVPAITILPVTTACLKADFRSSREIGKPNRDVYRVTRYSSAGDVSLMTGDVSPSSVITL